MTKFISLSQPGFFDDDALGKRTIIIPDPSWIKPLDDVGEFAPLVEVVNPSCRLPADAKPITEDLVRHLRSSPYGINWTTDPPSVNTQLQITAEQEAEILKNAALAELAIGDKVFTRCGKAGKSYPPEWLARDETLREIVRTGAGVIPAAPGYPAGT